MPTYEFRLPDGTIIERRFKMSEVPESIPNPDGAGEAVRIISGGDFVLKGSGFYMTDYGKDGKKDQRDAAEKAAKASAPKSDAAGSASESKGESKVEAKSESKAESKAESKTESKSEAKPAAPAPSAPTPPKSAS